MYLRNKYKYTRLAAHNGRRELISTHFGTTLYQKKYMHAPRAVHACTFFNVNVDADVNNLRRVSIAEQVNVIVIVNVLGELRFAKILKYQPHLIAGEVA